MMVDTGTCKTDSMRLDENELIDVLPQKGPADHSLVLGHL